jgi:hypothetical protein
MDLEADVWHSSDRLVYLDVVLLAAALSVLMLFHFLQRPSAPDVSTLAATRVETEKRAIWS